MRNPLNHSVLLLSAAIAASVPAIAASGASAGDTRADNTAAEPMLQAALAAAVTISDARLEIVAVERASADCVTTGPNARAEVSRPIDGSGRIAVKLIGRRSGGATCQVWAWAKVRVFAQVPVARRAVRAGDALAPATRTEEREIKSGHVPAVLTAGSMADRSFGAGQMIESDAIRAPGLRGGESVKVVIMSGALAIEQVGRAIPCARDRTCAVLPSGKHVEGNFVDGRLMVQMQ